MPRTWSPEQRKIAAERMRKTQAERKARLQGQAVVNPPANEDIVHAPVPSTPQVRVRRPVIQEQAFSIASLIEQLSSVPLDDISYADCGSLINALSACTTATALARRQKQEQLEAGTHRAPCSTCGRQIDISKSGGFQILTERDEHFQPINRYYCSQNCLLSKNMPSHARQTPKQKTGATA